MIGYLLMLLSVAAGFGFGTVAPLNLSARRVRVPVRVDERGFRAATRDER